MLVTEFVFSLLLLIIKYFFKFMPALKNKRCINQILKIIIFLLSFIVCLPERFLVLQCVDECEKEPFIINQSFKL